MAAARVLGAVLRIRSPHKSLKSFHSCSILCKDTETKLKEDKVGDEWEDVTDTVFSDKHNQYHKDFLEQRNIKTNVNLYEKFSNRSPPESIRTQDYKVTGSYSRQPRSYSSQDYNDSGSYSRQPRSYSSRDYNDSSSYNRQARSYSGRDYDTGNFGGHQRYSDFEFESSVTSPAFDPNIKKDVYEEHPDTAKRTEDEIKKFYADNNIYVMGSKEIRPILTFDELKGMEKLLRVIQSKNWKEPFPTQSVTWPIAMSGHDMVGIAKTGSGKTLGFVLPAILHILKQGKQKYRTPNIVRPSVLVMAPTRELTQQVESVVKEIAPHFGIRSGCAFGGTSVLGQLSKLRGIDILIATPGRLNDYLSRGSVTLEDCSYLVLDEADRMLDMGFEVQIRQIMRYIKPNRQVLMWSATWPSEIQALARNYLRDPVQIRIGSMDLMTNPDITESFTTTTQLQKFNDLCQLLATIATNYPDGCKTLVFVERKKTADELSRRLMAKGIPTYALHGDKSQSERDRVMDVFRKKKKILLIATDVASRGLDVSDIANVINYDMAKNGEDYVHRIGRTARGGRKGKSFSLVTDEDYSVLKDLKKMYKRQKKPVPEQILEILDMSAKFGRRSSNGIKRSHQRTPKFVDPMWRE